MNLAQNMSSQPVLAPELKQALANATSKIAPTWPLDQLIAVNPFWEMREQPIQQVSSRLAALSGAHCLMPKSYYKALYQQGQINDADLAAAAGQEQVDMSAPELLAFLDTDDNVGHWHNIADLLDQQRDPHKMAWRDEIIHQISQFCAAHYQQVRPILLRNDSESQPALFQHWLQVTKQDRGISIIMDEPGLHDYFLQLPDNIEDVFAQAIAELDLDSTVVGDYAHALLLDINGWGSWVAYLRWQGNLYGQPHDDMLQLLAIRLSWELVIWRYLKAQKASVFQTLQSHWRREKSFFGSVLKQHQEQQKPMWVWAKAAELNYQSQLNQKLLAADKPAQAAPALQAAFCIDVRSEVMRRALEAQDDAIQTLGFAGFFGLPLDYQPANSPLARPQLPGLLKPVIRVTEVASQVGIGKALNTRARFQTWSQAAPSAFSMVETMGWTYAFKMLKKSLFPEGDRHPVNQLTQEQDWEMSQDGQVLSVQDKAKLGKDILHAMGLKQFADTVLLVGHGSHTTNNLHAAGLDCGACGGQTGEVNVRVLAYVLNDKEVRAALAEMGVEIPVNTQFVAAIHNTTTDQIDCFQAIDDKRVSSWLAGAKTVAQRERAKLLDPGLIDCSAEQLDKAISQRSKDWSQVRPEWGLANNAAFIVAPRHWTKQVNLQGRSFLHDYQWQQDEGFAILELIMTAPMVVTNWINSQYNASVTDNLKYGSGNKVLHNAVGGHIGVFEGNGGDLRIGLPMQSLHNGERWMHQPQRLAVYLAAPREPIEAITAKHEAVRQLIDNEWLFVMRWSDGGVIERYFKGEWLEQAGS